MENTFENKYIRWYNLGMGLAALIISVIALVLAIYSIAQRVWSKPNLVIRFDSTEVEGGKVMTCELCNYPIAWGIKKKIGVRTMHIEDLVASFEIAEYGNNKVKYPGKVPHILKYDGISNAQRVNLAASIFPAYFGVASVYYDTKTVTVFEEDDADLPIGKYIVKVQAQFQENERKTERTLVVHGEYPYAYWE
jgi:hypothetical protein